MLINMLIAGMVTFMFIAMATYFLTKHSIFFWLAKACIRMDAALICTWDVLGIAVANWRQRIPGTVRQVQVEVVR